jgi:hypothetical protein
MKNILARTITLSLVFSLACNISLYHNCLKDDSRVDGIKISNFLARWIITDDGWGRSWSKELFHNFFDTSIIISIVFIILLLAPRLIKIVLKKYETRFTKKSFIGLITLITLLVLLICAEIMLPPFGVKSEYLSPNTTEKCYRIDNKFNNIDEFIDYIIEKNYPIDDFKLYDDTYDIDSIKKSIKIEYRVVRKIYKLEYKPNYIEANRHIIQVSSDGYISEVWSAGK